MLPCVSSMQASESERAFYPLNHHECYLIICGGRNQARIAPLASGKERSSHGVKHKRGERFVDNRRLGYTPSLWSVHHVIETVTGLSHSGPRVEGQAGAFNVGGRTLR